MVAGCWCLWQWELLGPSCDPGSPAGSAHFASCPKQQLGLNLEGWEWDVSVESGSKSWAIADSIYKIIYIYIYNVRFKIIQSMQCLKSLKSSLKKKQGSCAHSHRTWDRVCLVPWTVQSCASCHCSGSKLPIEQIPTSLNMNAMNYMFVKFVGQDRVSVGVHPPLLHRLRPPPNRQPLCYHPHRLGMSDASGNEVSAHLWCCKDTIRHQEFTIQENTFRYDERVVEYCFGCYGKVSQTGTC